MSNSTKVGTTILKFQSPHSATAPIENATKELYVLKHGTGYTSGTISLQGYPGQTEGQGTAGSSQSAQFSATYKVGIISWDYYYDADTLQPRKGSNYSFRNMSTFHGPVLNLSANGLAENVTQMSVDRCWRSSSAVAKHGLTSSHTGEIVVGCSPGMQFDVVDGRVFGVTFDNSSCLASGLTCSISLSGYGGAGAAAYFTTGISQVSLITAGYGYVCDWACFVSLHSTGAGAEQACLLEAQTCSDAVSLQALVIFGDVARVVSFFILLLSFYDHLREVLIRDVIL